MRAISFDFVQFCDGHALRGSYSYNAPAPGRFGLLENDLGEAGDQLRVRLVTPPVNGEVELQTNGAFRYVPFTNWNGDDTFTYEVTNGTETSNTATATIHVRPINDPPRTSIGFHLTEPNTSVEGQLSAIDDDGDPVITFRRVAGPDHGSLTLGEDGHYQYTPDLDFSGEDFFRFVASDGLADSDESFVRIVVDAPAIGVDDSYTILEDEPLIVGAPGVLANDFDLEGFLFANPESFPEHGVLALQGDGSFSYTPLPEFSGTDSFTYRLNDRYHQSTHRVEITVLNVNDVPQASDLDLLVAADTQFDGQLEATDAETEALLFEVDAVPANGTVDVRSDGSFTYTPTPGFVGTDSFTYRARDEVQSSPSATVSILVNRIPTAVDDEFTLDEDTSIQIGPPRVTLATLTRTDSDGTIETFEYSRPSSSFSAFSFGSVGVSVHLSGSDSSSWRMGLFAPEGQTLREGTYLNAASEIGPNTPAVDVWRFPEFCFDATGEFTIHVLDVVDGNISALSFDFLEHCEGFDLEGSVSVNASDPGMYGILANDLDTPTDRLKVTEFTRPQHGSLAVLPNGSFEYTPFPDYHGDDSFTYSVSDGIFTSDPATVTFHVNSVNDVPFVYDATFVARPDEVLAETLFAEDVEGGPLEFRSVSGPHHGNLVIHSDGTFEYTPDPGYLGSDAFEFVANDGTDDSPVGRVTLFVNVAPVGVEDSYTVAEDEVLAVGIPPFHHIVLESDPGDDVGMGRAFDVTAEDGVFYAGPAETTQISYYSPSLQLNFQFSGPDGPFARLQPGTYTTNDGSHMDITVHFFGCGRQGQFTVEEITYAADGQLITFVGSFESHCGENPDGMRGTIEFGVRPDSRQGVMANDLDSPSDPLIAMFTLYPQHGTLDLAPNGAFVYKPHTNYFGPDEFYYTITDGVETSDFTRVVINVTPVNDAPVVNPFTLDIPQKTTGTGQLTATDAEGDPVTFRLLETTPSGKLTFASDGSFTYKPKGGFTGTESFTVVSSDGQIDGPSRTILVRVHAPPVARDDAYTIDEDQPLVVGSLDPVTHLRIVSDPGDPVGGGRSYDEFVFGGFVFSKQPEIINGVQLGASNWLLNFTTGTSPLQPGTYVDSSLSVDDNRPSLSVTPWGPSCQTLTGVFTILEVNYTTFGSIISFAADFEQHCNGLEPALRGSIRFNAQSTEPDGVVLNDSDADGDRLSTRLVSSPSHGTLTLRSNGAFHYLPDPDFHGNDQFEYRAVDAFGESKIAKVKIRIRSVEDAPQLSSHTFSLTDTTIDGAVIGAIVATDPDGDALTYALLGSDTAVAIDRETGELRIRDEMQLDAESNPILYYTVEVGDGAFSSYSDLVIDVTPGLRGDMAKTGNILRIYGTSEADDIRISQGNDSNLVVTTNFGNQNFSSIRDVRIRGFSGDDYLSLALNHSARGLISAGTGNDTVYGGAADDLIWAGDGDDQIFGEEGNDILVGGAGADLLEGGRGKDLLIGGWNADTLRGGQLDDILIGGQTLFDSDQAALQAVLAEWSSSRTYTKRLANLSGTGTGPRKNDNLFLVFGETVFDDFESDSLGGDGGRDWFFHELDIDTLEDLASNEISGNP